MAAQTKSIKKCQLLKQTVMEWFADHPGESQVPARELTDFFVKKQIFEEKKGYAYGTQMTSLLNRLYSIDLIQMVPHAYSVGSTWYFQRLPGDHIAQDGAMKKTQMLEEAVTDWFADNPAETKVLARELMDFFVKKKIFKTNKYKGQEVIQLLKRLDSGNLLNMVPHAMLEGRGSGSQWFFQRLASDGAPHETFRKYSPEVESYRSSLMAGYKD